MKTPLFFLSWVDLTTTFLIVCRWGTNLSQGDQAWSCKTVELNTEYWMVWQSFWIKLMKIYDQSTKECEQTGSPLFYDVMPPICPLFYWKAVDLPVILAHGLGGLKVVFWGLEFFSTLRTEVSLLRWTASYGRQVIHEIIPTRRVSSHSCTQ